MTKSVSALLLIAAIVTAAHFTPAMGHEAFRHWRAGTDPVLYLPKHFEQVPWLSVKTPAPKPNTDLLIGPKLERMEAFKLDAPFSQFSMNTELQPHFN